MANNTIGGEAPAKGKKCAYCGEPYGYHEFTSYMLKSWSNHVSCFACLKNNYLASTDNLVLKFIFILLAILTGIAFFLGVNLAMALATYNENDGTYMIVWWVAVIGLFGGVAIASYMMSIFRWMTGSLVEERIDKLL